MTKRNCRTGVTMCSDAEGERVMVGWLFAEGGTRREARGDWEGDLRCRGRREGRRFKVLCFKPRGRFRFLTFVAEGGKQREVRGERK